MLASKDNAGYFENGDTWTGWQECELKGGPTFYRAIDKDGNEYDTEEIPTAYPLFEMVRFDGQWSGDQAQTTLDRIVKDRLRSAAADWQIVPSAGDRCPKCGADLELLVDMETASVDGERCTENAEHFDNLFVTGATWPTD